MVCRSSNGSHCVLPLTGVPGTGKSSVGRVLSRLIGCRFMEVSEVARLAGVVGEDPTGRATMIVRDFEPVAEVLAENSRRACIVLATHILGPLLTLIGNLVPVIVVLRTHPSVLLERLSARGWPRGKVAENVLAEFMGVLYDEFDVREYPVVEVDTTHATPTGAAEEALARLLSWRIGRFIDWLADPAAQDLAATQMAVLDSEEYGFGV